MALLTTNPKDRLEGWWKLDEVTAVTNPRYDSGILGNDLTEAPNGVANSTTVKRVGDASAGQFATDGLQRIDASLSANFPGKDGGNTTAFTAGCYVHPVAGAGTDMILCKASSFSLYYAHTGTKITAQFGAAAAIGANAVTPVGQWWCAAIRWDGTEFSLWINGVKQTAVTPAATMVQNQQPFVIGAQDGSGTNFLAGYVNDAFVYSRALSDSEMRMISMVGPTAFFAPSKGLLGYWIMDAAAGSTRFDYSPGMAHLLESGLVPQQTTIKQEGVASAGKFTTTPSVLRCADVDLPSGFPAKNGAAALEWTIGGWFYQDATANTCAFKKGTAIELQWGNPAPNLYGLLFNNALLLVSPSIPIQAWHHIVVRWRGEDDDLVDFIIDGVKQSGGIVQTANAGNASDFLVGAASTVPTLAMNGYVDELFVYNRALADEGVLSIYQGGIASFISPSFSEGVIQFPPGGGRKIPKPKLHYPAIGQRTGGVSGGGRRHGSGARW